MQASTIKSDVPISKCFTAHVCHRVHLQLHIKTGQMGVCVLPCWLMQDMREREEEVKLVADERGVSRA